MSEEIVVDMNAKAQVRLTEVGKRTYSRYYHIKHEGETCESELWHLFEVFGPTITRGAMTPFVGNEIVVLPRSEGWDVRREEAEADA